MNSGCRARRSARMRNRSSWKQFWRREQAVKTQRGEGHVPGWHFRGNHADRECNCRSLNKSAVIEMRSTNLVAGGGPPSPGSLLILLPSLWTARLKGVSVKSPTFIHGWPPPLDYVTFAENKESVTEVTCNCKYIGRSGLRSQISWWIPTSFQRLLLLTMMTMMMMKEERNINKNYIIELREFIFTMEVGS